MDLLGDRADLLVGEATEGVLDHLEVLVEVARPFLAGQAREEGRVAVGGDETPGVVEGARLDAPVGLAAERHGSQVADGLGHEGAGQVGLQRPLRPVVEHGPARLDRRGGVGDVVGEVLVVVEAVGSGELTDGRVDHVSSHVEHGGGGGEVSSRHGRRR